MDNFGFETLAGWKARTTVTVYENGAITIIRRILVPLEFDKELSTGIKITERFGFSIWEETMSFTTSSLLIIKDAIMDKLVELNIPDDKII